MYDELHGALQRQEEDAESTAELHDAEQQHCDEENAGSAVEPHNAELQHRDKHEDTEGPLALNPLDVVYDTADRLRELAVELASGKGYRTEVAWRFGHGVI